MIYLESWFDDICNSSRLKRDKFGRFCDLFEERIYSGLLHLENLLINYFCYTIFVRNIKKH